jgi:hypothetical protein
MAVFAATDYSIVLNGVDLSSYVQSIDIPIVVNDLDTTGMGTTNASFHTRIAGLRDWTATISFIQDFTGSQVDATVSPLLFNGTVVTLTVKPTSAAVSVSNPRYFGSVIAKDYKPIAGAVGTLAMAVCNFAGAGALTRATT